MPETMLYPNTSQNHQLLAEFLNEFAESHFLCWYAHYFLVRDKLDWGAYVFDPTILPDIIWAFQDFSADGVFRGSVQKSTIFFDVMRSYGWRTWGEGNPSGGELSEGAIQCVREGIRDYVRTHVTIQSWSLAWAATSQSWVVADVTVERGVKVLSGESDRP